MSEDHDPGVWVEAQLDFLYGDGDSEEKTAHRQRVVGADGAINAFQRKALEGMVKRKQDEDSQQAVSPAVAPLPALPEDLADDIPEPVEGYEDRVDAVRLIKAACPIVTAVTKWGKPQPDLKIGTRTEGIHVRCPFPTHEDNNPSAWINTTKDTWFCGACQEGGDQIAFYAARKGMNQTEVRGKDTFPQILREMADELGIDIDPPAETPPRSIPDPDPIPIPVPAAPDNLPPTDPEPDPRNDVDPLDVSVLPTYDWQNLDTEPSHLPVQVDGVQRPRTTLT